MKPTRWSPDIKWKSTSSLRVSNGGQPPSAVRPRHHTRYLELGRAPPASAQGVRDDYDSSHFLSPPVGILSRWSGSTNRDPSVIRTAGRFCHAHQVRS